MVVSDPYLQFRDANETCDDKTDRSRPRLDLNPPITSDAFWLCIEPPTAARKVADWYFQMSNKSNLSSLKGAWQ